MICRNEYLMCVGHSQLKLTCNRHRGETVKNLEIMPRRTHSAEPRHRGSKKKRSRNKHREEAPATSDHMTPSAPPPAVAHAQIRQPAAHLDSFDASAVAASGYSFSVGACTGGRPEEASEDVLLEAGLAGAAAYDLRLLEMEVREQLSFATDDELGVGEADEILDEEMRAIGSATSFGRKRQDKAAGGDEKPAAPPGRRGRSAVLIGRSAEQVGGRRASVTGGSFKQPQNRTQQQREFEERAKQLAEKKKKAAVSTAASIEAAALQAAVRLDKVSKRRPQPTPVSDLKHVMGWLDRHLDQSRIALGQKISTLTNLDAAEDTVEGMLAKWKNRATAKLLASGNSAAESALSGETAAARSSSPKGFGLTASPPHSPLGSSPMGSPGGSKGSGGKGGGNWLADLESEIKAEGQTPEAMRASVWEKQKALEVTIGEEVAKRRLERAERRRKMRIAKARQREESQRMGLVDEEDEDEEAMDSDEEASGGGRIGSLADGLHEDESVAKFLKQVPILEERKGAARLACRNAEYALKNQLNRWPTEVERREDPDWCRAAIKYKEADQALFVARSLTSWDD